MNKLENELERTIQQNIICKVTELTEFNNNNICILFCWYKSVKHVKNCIYAISKKGCQ